MRFRLLASGIGGRQHERVVRVLTSHAAKGKVPTVKMRTTREHRRAIVLTLVAWVALAPLAARGQEFDDPATLADLLAGAISEGGLSYRPLPPCRLLDTLVTEEPLTPG